MKILVHSAPTTLANYRHPNLGVLSSPRRFYLDVEGWPWAADNDAFSAWDETLWRHMLKKITDIPGCLFITAPDVVGDAEATLDQFEHWQMVIRATGQPVALVGQDGLDLGRMPWADLDAFFIGGTTLFKMGDVAREAARQAKARGKWVHMGRVNSHQRIRYAKAIGCDSVDGTSFSWFKDAWLQEFLDHAAGPVQETFL